MENIIYNELVPVLLFFIAFAVVFSLMELILIFLLDWFIRGHWEWMVDVVMRYEVHHRKIIKYSSIAILGAFVIIVIVYSPLVNVIALGSYEFRCFAILLALVILLIYLINIRKGSKLRIEKEIYAIIFFVISFAIYVPILSIANESYDDYLKYVNNKLVNPTVKEIESVIEEKKDKKMLDDARLSYLNGECTDVDYTKEEKSILMKNILLVGHDSNLAYGDKFVYIDNPEESLKGKSCTADNNTLLLLENGDWYWVSEEYIKFIE